MNIRGFSLIGIVITVVLLVILLPIKSGDVPPLIEDKVEVKDDSAIGLGQNTSDIPIMTDSAVVENKISPDFYIDENGTKHYIIEVIDAPILR